MENLTSGFVSLYIVVLGDKRLYQRRLNELQDGANTFLNGSSYERSRKIAALKFLIAQ